MRHEPARGQMVKMFHACAPAGSVVGARGDERIQDLHVTAAGFHMCPAALVVHVELEFTKVPGCSASAADEPPQQFELMF